MTISLKQGKLKGIEKKSIPSGKKYYSFLGIPYAESPINFLRFQAPRPHKGWTGIFDATKARNVCLQQNREISPTPFGDEDCLFINVHTPEYPTEIRKLKPVMVFVHGGGFCVGSGQLYSPDYLMGYDVLVVTFNYRLHVFGFLNLGLPECPGNTGLKDQMLAFEWIKENIRVFGGDPSNVTAFGESAGAASVHYLMISPLSKDLFNRAILQSGSALCNWAFTDQSTEYAFRLGSILGCNATNHKELLYFLLEVPANKLLKAMLKLAKECSQGGYDHFPFVPSIELCVNSNSTFLPQNPEILLKKAPHIPCITGLNNLEGLIFLPGIMRTDFLAMDRKFNFIPRNWKLNADEILQIVNKIKEFYYDGKTEIKEIVSKTVDLITDLSFGRRFYEVFQHIVEENSEVPIYLYNFCYDGYLNVYKKLILTFLDEIELKGACHADEIFYLFSINIEMYPVDDMYQTELTMINTMCTFWTNFAKYGMPSTSKDSLIWQPTSVNKPCYLQIDDKIKMREGKINDNRMNFWNSLERDLQLRKTSIKLKL